MVEDILIEACNSASPQIARSLYIAIQDIAMLQATLPTTAHARQLQACPLYRILCLKIEAIHHMTTCMPYGKTFTA